MMQDKWKEWLFVGKAERITILIVSLFLALGGILALMGAYNSTDKTLVTKQDTIVQNPNPPQNDTPYSARQYYTFDTPPPTTAPRQDSIIRTESYVGAPEKLSAYPKKQSPHQPIDLNRIDSAHLVLLPGIGATTAKRICKYRDLLGGYYTVLQLQEVYGMSAERFAQIRSYFVIQTPPLSYRWQEIGANRIPRHPYLNHRQAQAIRQEIERGNKIASWKQLQQLGVFSHDDSVRLAPYFLF